MDLDQILRVGPAEHRVEEPAVRVPVGDPGGRTVRLGVGDRPLRVQVERDPDGRARRGAGPQRLHGEPVGDEQVVRDAQRGRPVADARGLAPLGVAEEGHHPRLVVRDPLRHDVAELVRHRPRVLREALGRVARRPAAAVLQRLREVPVIQRGHGLDAALEQPLDEPAVEAHALAVERPAAVGLHARPGDREAVALDPHRGEQVEVVAASGGSGRRRRRRCRRRRPRRACGRSGPRSTRRGRPRPTRPRSGRRRSPRRTGSPAGRRPAAARARGGSTSSLHRPCGQSPHEPPLGGEEGEHHRERGHHACCHELCVLL